MKHFPMKLLFAAALAFAGASAAQAFTFESAAPNGSATRSYVDPVDKYEPKSDSRSRFDGNSDEAKKQDGFHLQFGGQSSFDQRYNPNNLFDPNKR